VEGGIKMNTAQSIIRRATDKFIQSCSREGITKSDIQKETSNFTNYIAQQAVSFAFKNYMDMYKAKHGEIPKDKKDQVKNNVLMVLKKDTHQIKDFSNRLANVVLHGGLNSGSDKKTLYTTVSRIFLWFYMRGTHQANLLFVGQPQNNLFDGPIEID
jgi:hypothetical protein